MPSVIKKSHKIFRVISIGLQNTLKLQRKLNEASVKNNPMETNITFICYDNESGTLYDCVDTYSSNNKITCRITPTYKTAHYTLFRLKNIITAEKEVPLLKQLFQNTKILEPEQYATL